jgi:hypothetical protein
VVHDDDAYSQLYRCVSSDKTRRLAPGGGVAVGKLLVDSLDSPPLVTGQALAVLLNEDAVIDKTPVGRLVFDRAGSAG